MSERRNNGNHRFSNDDCRGKGSKKGGFGRKISGAAYGGGKNYSYVDTSALIEKFPFGENLSGTFRDYNVRVSLFGSTEPIYCSAGREDFRFKVYCNSSTFKYQHQDGGVDYSSMLYKK